MKAYIHAVLTATFMVAVGTGVFVVTGHALDSCDREPAPAPTVGALTAPYIDDVVIACDADGEEIKLASGQSHGGCECQNNSATAVYSGGPSVGTSDTSYCDGCAAKWWVAGNGEHCITASGTVNVPCKCGVPVKP